MGRHSRGKIHEMDGTRAARSENNRDVKGGNGNSKSSRGGNGSGVVSIYLKVILKIFKIVLLMAHGIFEV